MTEVFTNLPKGLLVLRAPEGGALTREIAQQAVKKQGFVLDNFEIVEAAWEDVKQRYSGKK